MRRAGPCALLCLLALAACDGMRDDPPPVARIAIAADGSLRLDGRPTDAKRMERELTRRADEAMNPKLSRTRLQVRITFDPNADYGRVQEVQERCQQLGISVVEVQR